LWNVIFLSRGTMSFKGVRRNREIKFLHTGSKMNATSTWRMRAAVRAIAGGDGRKYSYRKGSVRPMFILRRENHVLNPYPNMALALLLLSFN
jgi:hypothetical protein